MTVLGTVMRTAVPMKSARPMDLLVRTCSAGYHDTDGDDTCNACTRSVYKSAVGDAACTTAQEGYFAADASGNALSSPHEGAVGGPSARTYAIDLERAHLRAALQRAQPSVAGYHSAAGLMHAPMQRLATSPQDVNRDALSSPYEGAVRQTAAQQGFFAADASGNALSSPYEGAVQEVRVLMGLILSTRAAHLRAAPQWAQPLVRLATSISRSLGFLNATSQRLATSPQMSMAMRSVVPMKGLWYRRQQLSKATLRQRCLRQRAQ